jgi:hypothetical protein
MTPTCHSDAVDRICIAAGIVYCCNSNYGESTISFSPTAFFSGPGSHYVEVGYSDRNGGCPTLKDDWEIALMKFARGETYSHEQMMSERAFARWHEERTEVAA